MASDAFVSHIHHADHSINYPVNPASIALTDGVVPRMLLVRLGGESLTFDECQTLFDTLRSRLRELGIKPAGDEMDIQYCQLLSDGGATWAQYIYTYGS